MKKVALGKGLDALIGDASKEIEKEDIPVKMVLTGDIIGNEYQPRSNFNREALNELKISIKERGIIQPLLVSKFRGKFQLIAGERRLRAARELNLEKIPVLIKKIKGDEDLVELALIENIQREDLNPIEKAQGYKRLIDEFKLTQDEVSEKVGKDRSTISNTLRLLELEEKIKNLIFRGEINFGQGKALLAIEDPKERIRLALLAAKRGISVRELESIASSGKIKKRKKEKETKDIHTIEVEEKLQEQLKTRVFIKESIKDRGKIEIEYYSKDQRENLINRLMKV